MYPPFDHWLWLIPACLIGACIGSFLNVVIYRVPLGMSVNHPKRSFCPLCKSAIAMVHNLPIISWLWLRGRCASCHAAIPVRYFGVELLTAGLFVATWCLFPPQVAPLLWVLVSLLVAITFIDAEHMIIPTSLTWTGTVAGLVAAAVYPSLANLGGDPLEMQQATAWDGLIQSAVGFVLGFFGLWLVVNLGKMAFGKKEMVFEQEAAWHLREATNDEEPLHFVIDGEETPWWDLFNRKSDRLLVECSEIRVDGKEAGKGTLVIREDAVELPNGSTHRIEDLKSLEGRATSVVIPREAMGFGDVHLMGMIGAFFGWAACFYTLFAASLFAIVAALLGRVGFGRQLPFGPFLALGILSWMFGGWKLWQWYLFYLGPLFGS